jgi:hypothetical protein
MASGPPFSPPHTTGAPPIEPAPQPAGDYRWLAPPTLQTMPGIDLAPSGRAAMYDLRPLSTGEVLDRTFSLYRSRFLLFAGIASLSAAVRLLASGVQLAVQQVMLRRGSLVPLGITSNLLSLVASALSLLAFAVTQAATMWAVGEVYLGRSTGIAASLRAVLPRWLRFVGIALWQIGSGIWPVLLVLAAFGGYEWVRKASFNSLGFMGALGVTLLLLIPATAAGIIFYLRNLLAVPAAVREGLTVRQAMRRSKALSQNAKGKLFLVLLVASGLYMVMGIVLSIVLFVLMFLHRDALTPGINPVQQHFLAVGVVTLAVGFVGYTLISPVIMLGISLVYFDQRVRKEAFDIAVLLGDESFSVPFAAAAPMSAFAGVPTTAEPPGGASGL